MHMFIQYIHIYSVHRDAQEIKRLSGKASSPLWGCVSSNHLPSKRHKASHMWLRVTIISSLNTGHQWLPVTVEMKPKSSAMLISINQCYISG